MKKTLLALAVLGSLSATAFAQSNVTVYGVMDLGLVSVSGATASTNVATAALPAYSNGKEFKLRDGVNSGSRLGFRGTEDLGGGMSAMFVLEAGVLADTGASDQGGILFGRQAFVGIKNEAGTLTFGRQYAPHYLAFKAIDAMSDEFGGGAGILIPNNGKRVNNAIRYATPTISGFSGELFYSLGEVTGNTTASSNRGATGTYSDGPLMVKVAYHEANNATA